MNHAATKPDSQPRTVHEAERAGQKEDTASASDEKVVELGGPKGPEPTRYGDWERKGRCVDF